MKVNPYKKLISLGSIYTLGSIMENGLSFLLLPLLTVYLTVADFGVVGIMTATLALISALLQTPFSSGFQRFYYMEGYKKQRGKMLFTGFSLILIPASLVALCFYFYCEPLAATFLGNKDFAYIFQIYALIIIFYPCQQLLLALLRIQQKAKLFVTLNVSRLITYVALVLYLLVYKDMGLKGLVLGYLYKSVFDVILLLPYLIRNFQFSFGFAHIIPLLRYGYPLVLTLIGLTIMNSSDRYVLEYFDPSLEDTGLYSFGYKFGTIVGILLTVPMQQTVNPIIMEIEDRTEELKSFLAQTTTFFFIAGVLLFLGISLFAKEIVSIVAQNDSFKGSWVIIPIIAFAFVMDGMKDMFAKGLVMAKKTLMLGMIFLSAAFLNIGLNFLFIPYLNIFGAAFATLLSFFWLAGCNIYFSNKYYRIEYDFVTITKISLLGFTFAGVGLLMNELSISLIFIIILKLVLLSGFAFIIWNIGFLSQPEKEKILLLVNKLKSRLHF